MGGVLLMMDGGILTTMLEMTATKMMMMICLLTEGKRVASVRRISWWNGWRREKGTKFMEKRGGKVGHELVEEEQEEGGWARRTRRRRRRRRRIVLHLPLPPLPRRYSCT